MGFTEGPGGQEYNNRQVLAYHVYCLFVDSKKPSMFLQHIISLLSKEGCDVFTDLLYDIRDHDAKKLGLAGFMTEFSDNGLGVTPELINFATKKMDEFMHGWSFWILTPDPKVKNSSVIFPLARPYPYKIAGTPSQYSFDPDKKVFQLTYMPCTEEPCASKPTEIFTSKNYAFLYGMKVNTESENTVTHNLNETTQMLFLNVTKIVRGKPVQVTLITN